MPLFTIATVCLNSEKTIERTILSILQQDFLDFEYIIIDGRSTDKTIDIIKRYESSFEGRMSWTSESDNGIYDAFNKACKQANGQYIWLVNSDDYIEPHSLKLLHKIISTFNPNCYPIISGGLRFIINDNIRKVCTLTENDAEILYNLGDIGINHPASLIPKYIYEKIGYYDDQYRIMADMDWFHRAYESKCPFLWIEDVITNMQEGGISTKLNFMTLAKDRWYYSKKYYNGRTSQTKAFSAWMIMHLKGHIKMILFKNRLWKKK